MVAMTDHRDQLLVARVRPEPGKGLQVIVKVSRVRRLRRRADRARVPVLESRRTWSGIPEWRDDPRFATRAGWAPAFESEIRPRRRVGLTAPAGSGARAHRRRVVAGPSNHAADVITDPHVAARHNAGRDARTDGVEVRSWCPATGEAVEGERGPRDPRPVGGRAHRFGPHAELGLSDAELRGSRERGVIS